MNKKALLAIPIIFLIFLSGCAYVDTQVPFDSDINQTDLGTKKGTADAYCILWLFAWGDAGYAKAAENGNITVMKHADQEFHQILFGCYTHWKIIVYGD